MTNPLVTIGVPFFNRVATLADTIRSVFAQTFGAWELLLIDDGSSDGSLELARAVRDPRVRVVSDGVNRRLPVRRNETADLAGTDFVAWIDSDDLMHPERLEHQMAILAGGSAPDLVSSNMYGIDDHTALIGLRSTHYRDAFRTGVVFGTATGRREWFVANRFDVDFPRAQDRELLVRALDASRFQHELVPHTFVRVGHKPRLEQREDFRGSLAEDRRILRRYGHRALGRVGTWAALAESGAKSAIYAMLNSARADGWIIDREFKPMSPAEAERGRVALAQILATRVPGLD